MFFFWIRICIFGFGMLKYKAIYKYTHELIFLKILDDEVTLMQYNTVMLFIILESMVNSNVYELNISIFMLLHNSLMTLIIIFKTKSSVTHISPLVRALPALFYILETLYLLFSRYKWRGELSKFILKNVGLSAQINGKCNLII